MFRNFGIMFENLIKSERKQQKKVQDVRKFEKKFNMIRYSKVKLRKTRKNFEKIVKLGILENYAQNSVKVV